MRFYTEYLTFQTARRREYLNITEKVQQAVEKGNIQDGMALVSAMHITAGVWVNDAEDGLIADIDEWLEYLPRSAKVIVITAPGKPMATHI